MRHLDDKKIRTIDSGVMGSWTQDFRSSGHDRNVECATMSYFGWLEEIIELNFMDYTQVVFSCMWYRSHLRGPGPALKMDESGLQRINTRSTLLYQRMVDEPLVYPDLVEEFFYVKCSDDPDWSIVNPHIPRERQFLQDRHVIVVTDVHEDDVQDDVAI